MTKAIMTARNTISFCSAAHILDRDCIECDIRVIIWNDLYINRYVSNLPRIKWSDMQSQSKLRDCSSGSPAAQCIYYQTSIILI